MITNAQEQPLPQAAARVAVQRERRGTVWVIGSFIVCPCHLPVTFAVLTTVFGGTALGAAVREYPVVAGAILTTAWVAGTWRGVRLLGNVRNGVCEIR